ncbi:MAG: hypothetical protein M1608_10305 [Candidatus Omnitrophica bacterium]|nr:hypothetical protein [Candidatus Omnitrophota bacterium]
MTTAKPDPPLDFTGWPAALAVAPLRPEEFERYTITPRWYLNFCRRSRAPVCKALARDFITQAKQPPAWRLGHGKRTFVDKIASTEPAGFTAISRWLSGATPPVADENEPRTPEGCQRPLRSLRDRI